MNLATGLSTNEHEFIESIRMKLAPCPMHRPAAINQQYRNAAVLIPFFFCANQWNILFTRRTDIVQAHKGQVAFPGGAVDPQDLSIQDTALREAYEEIGLETSDVQLLGCASEIASITHYHITPVVGVIPWPYSFHLQKNEVSRVFGIPINWLAESNNWRMKNVTTERGHLHDVIFFDLFDNELLWGITARITVDLIRKLVD